MDSGAYGKEIIIDMHECDVSKFNRKELRKYFKELCALIDMERCDLYFWDYVGVPQKEIDAEPDHLVGTSAVQFIKTSNIVIHTLDRLGKVFLNIFSCKDYNSNVVIEFSKNFFGGKIINITEVERR